MDTILETMDEETAAQQQLGQAEQDTRIFRGVRALLALAKQKSGTFSSSFTENYQFLLGENHWPVPTNAIAAQNQANNNMSVRNWLFATCDYKASALLQDRQSVTAIPTGSQVDVMARWQIQEIIAEENRRLKAPQYDEDVLWDGMACGKGYTRILMVEDPRSGTKRPKYEAMDPSRLFRDPDADRLANANFVFYEVWMPAEKIREAFPDTWRKINFDSEPVGTSEDWNNSSYRSRTDEEILESGAGREFHVGMGGELKERGKWIAFGWFKNEEVIKEMESRILAGEKDLCVCAECGCIFEPPMPDLDAPPEIMGLNSCPECGSLAVATTRIPAKTEDVPIETNFRYPHGRLIVTCTDCILYEGANPDELGDGIDDDIYPIAEYTHYRVPHRFHGYGEVQHLRHTQLNADKNMAQLMDYLHTSVAGALEYPQQADVYRTLGNAPNARIGLPINLIGLARYLPPAPFNLQAFSMADETIRRDFQQMSGITDISTGIAPNAPTSGKEVQARVAAGGVRMQGHRNRLNEYRTQRDTKLWQLLWQHKRQAEFYPIRKASGEIDVQAITIANLPRGTRIIVSSYPEDIERNKLTGQVIQQWSMQGLLPFMPDLMLPATGIPMYDAMAIKQRLELFQAEQQKAEEEAAMQEERFSGEVPEGVPV